MCHFTSITFELLMVVLKMLQFMTEFYKFWILNAASLFIPKLKF